MVYSGVLEGGAGCFGYDPGPGPAYYPSLALCLLVLLVLPVLRSWHPWANEIGRGGLGSEYLPWRGVLGSQVICVRDMEKEEV